MLFAHADQLRVCAVRVELDLVERRFDLGRGEEVMDLGGAEVRDADGGGEAGGVELLERGPGGGDGRTVGFGGEERCVD